MDVFDALVSAALAAIGWFLKTVWGETNQLQNELTRLREHIPQHYVSKEDFKENFDRLFYKLDRIESKLDGKLDKGSL